MSSFESEITQRLRAGYQMIHVPSFEEARCLTALGEVAKSRDMDFRTWDCTNGFSHLAGTSNRTQNVFNETVSLMKVAEPSYAIGSSVLTVFLDTHPYYVKPDFNRMLRYLSEHMILSNQSEGIESFSKPIVFLHQPWTIPEFAYHCMTTVEFELPDVKHLALVFDEIVERLDNKNKEKLTPTLRHKVIQNLRGLTSTEASNCLSLCLVKHKGFTEDVMDTIEVCKSNIIKQSQALEYIPRKSITNSNLGGYDELVKYIKRSSIAYSPEAESINLDMPKGISLIGVPGTGKSRCAELIANILDMPLVKFDFSSVFNALVGESERRIREVIKTVTALGGCVMLIDEADKAIAGSSEATGDSGVTRRVFGQLLTWLGNKNDRTFVVMTANRTKGLPPELLRKGRFDEIFYVDIPKPEELKSIFEIHLNKRGIDSKVFNEKQWKDILKQAQGFVGSEAEEAVKISRLNSFQNNTKNKAVPSFEDIKNAIEDLTLTKVVNIDSANIAAIREFGLEKARPVSTATYKETKVKPTKKGRSLDLNLGFSDN